MTRKLEAYRKMAERSPISAAEQLVVMDHALDEAMSIVCSLEEQLKSAHGVISLAQDLADAADAAEEQVA